MLLLLPAVLSLAAASCCTADVGVRHLVGEPDYRRVTLHWEADQGRQAEFTVRYCELQTWGVQRCRSVPAAAPRAPDDTYTMAVEGLRMATTYSFEVRPLKTGRDDRADGENRIIVPTKGFSAKATQCLPHASEIEVSTGPHFAGRIAVEAADGERCAVDGEPKSEKDTYILRISHKECGSYVNKTTVATYVLVQENLPILTHSTRRFLVLCTYQPETLTVRAGLSLPSGKGHSAPVPYDQAYSYQSARSSRHLRPAKLQQHQETDKQEESSPPVALISLLIIASICCTSIALFRWHRNRSTLTADNVSISSNCSSSTADHAELDNVSVISKGGVLIRSECPVVQGGKLNRY